MKKINSDWRLWIIIGLSVLGIFYQIISNYSIRGNEIKHIWMALTKIESRLEKIEDRLWK